MIVPGAASVVLAAAELVEGLSGIPGVPLAIVGWGRDTAPAALALYAGSAGASVGAVRWLVGRRAAAAETEDGGSESSTSPSATTSEAAATDGPAPKEVAFTLPGFLPVSRGIRRVTHDELHAIELGLVVGAIAIWLRSIGWSRTGTAILVAFVAGSLGFRRYASKAFRTLRHEPWYGLIALAAGAGVSWVVFVEQPGLLADFDPGSFF